MREKFFRVKSQGFSPLLTVTMTLFYCFDMGRRQTYCKVTISPIFLAGFCTGVHVMRIIRFIIGFRLIYLCTFRTILSRSHQLGGYLLHESMELKFWVFHLNIIASCVYRQRHCWES